MFLVVSNWDISNCTLSDVHSANEPSIAGNSFELPPLDCVAGDILSLNFDVIDIHGRLHVIDNACLESITEFEPVYIHLSGCADDFENSDHYDLSTINHLNRFANLTSGKNEKYCDLRHFEIYLAQAKITEPIPFDKGIVGKGFWSDAEEYTGTVAVRKVQESFLHHEGALYFDTLESEKKNIDFHCRYNINGFSDLALVSFYLTLKSGHTFSRCSHCGRLFSPSRKGEKYCTRQSLAYPHLNCKEAAKYELQLQRERASESGKIYKSVNTMLAAKVDFAKSDDEREKRENELYSFRKEAKDWRNSVKQGTASESEYISFLNSKKKNRGKT